MATAGGPLAVAGSPFTPLVQGLVFGVALTVVLVAGAELATSAMMILTQGALRGAIGWGRAGLTLLACLGGNLLGAMLFAFLVHVSGVAGARHPRRDRPGGDDRAQGRRDVGAAAGPRDPVQPAGLPGRLERGAAAQRGCAAGRGVRVRDGVHHVRLRARRRQHDDVLARPLRRPARGDRGRDGQEHRPRRPRQPRRRRPPGRRRATPYGTPGRAPRRIDSSRGPQSGTRARCPATGSRWQYGDSEQRRHSTPPDVRQRFEEHA